MICPDVMVLVYAHRADVATGTCGASPSSAGTRPGAGPGSHGTLTWTWARA